MTQTRRSEPSTSSEQGSRGRLSRRLVLGGGGAALGVGLASRAGQPAAAAPVAQLRGWGGSAYRSSLRSASSFLAGVTDAYRSSGARLVQSYQDESGLGDIGFSYDALTVIALLAVSDVKRARSIGDALRYAQTHDPDYSDGRVRQAYHVDAFTDSAGKARPGSEFGLVGTAVGDMAWTGLAFAQLVRRTRNQSYLDGLLAIAGWIVDNTYSTTGLGGYTFGATAGLEEHKSTEHNIDVYALFRLVASITGDKIWLSRADHAAGFVQAEWNPDGKFFWTGSDDGSKINKNPLQLPEDVQTWSYLAAHAGQYADSIDWAAGNLATTDTPLRVNSVLTGNTAVSGVAFASGSLLTDTSQPIGGQSYNPKPDSAAVWFEGTAHLALASAERNRSGDRDHAAQLLANIRIAQQELGTTQTFGTKSIKGGVVAASSPMDTGFGFSYLPNLHCGATSWYVMAAAGANPYLFL